MRRKRIAAFQPVSLRNGVIASVMQRNRSVQTPVSLVRSLRGLGLRFPVSAAQTSQVTGPSDATKTSGLRTTRTLRSERRIPEPKSRIPSVVLLQVHPAVQAGDLIAVPVEHHRLPA